MPARTDYILTVETDPKPEDLAVVKAQYAARYPDLERESERRDLGIFVRGDGGVIRGGVYGWIAGGWLYICTLWLHESLRGGGWGSALVRLIEDAAAARGVARSFLTTASFQARPFYEKLGYHVFITHRDFVAGHDLYTLKKENLSPLDAHALRDISRSYSLKLDDPPDPADANDLDERLADFNRGYIGDTPHGPLAVFIRDSREGRVTGGLAGWRFGHSLTIEYLGFDDGARRRGAAAGALARMERELTPDGGSLLSPPIFIRFTGDDALPVFREAGYDVLGVHEDYPAAHTTYYLVKTLHRG